MSGGRGRGQGHRGTEKMSLPFHQSTRGDRGGYSRGDRAGASRGVRGGFGRGRGEPSGPDIFGYACFAARWQY